MAKLRIRDGKTVLELNNLKAITIHVRFTKSLSIRLRIGLFLVYLGARIASFSYQLEEDKDVP